MIACLTNRYHLVNTSTGFTASPCHFYHAPHAKLIEELLTAIKASQVCSGVVLSGPKGVGKTAIGLQAFLCCQALGHLAVYISDSQSWIKEAELGRGDEYLLEEFFRQNVDRIASMPALRTIFLDRLRGVPVHAAMIDQLLDFMAAGPRPRPAIALIVDNVQHISNAIARMNEPTVTVQERTGGAYFHTSWTSWNTPNGGRFIRMDIGSPHGMCEFRLSDGNRHRARFVCPWPLETARVALAHPQSPAFVERTEAHDRIIHIAGGVVRKLMQCLAVLPAGRVTEEILDDMEHHMRAAMSSDCAVWLSKNLSGADRRTVARQIIPLLQGEVWWFEVVGAYDCGLVALTSSNAFVRPISPVAGSVLHQQLSSVLLSLKQVSLSDKRYSFERDSELERQLHTCLTSNRVSVGTKCLNVDDGPGSAINVHVDYALLFHEPKDTAWSKLRSILYIPDRPKYPCDAIIVPAAKSADCDNTLEASSSNSKQVSEPVLVWECSETDPRDPMRVDKIRKWFVRGALIDALQVAHPGRRITILICWPEKLAKSGYEKCAILDDLAKRAGVDLFVVDSDGLSTLGLAI